MKKFKPRIFYKKVVEKGWNGMSQVDTHHCSGGLCARTIKRGDDAFFVGELFNTEAQSSYCCSKQCLKNLTESWDMHRNDVLSALERGMDA